jgi:hypothetical protein
MTTLKEVQEVDEKTFSFKDYIVKASEEFGNDAEFLVLFFSMKELLKSVNGSI